MIEHPLHSDDGPDALQAMFDQESAPEPEHHVPEHLAGYHEYGWATKDMIYHNADQLFDMADQPAGAFIALRLQPGEGGRSADQYVDDASIPNEMLSGLIEVSEAVTLRDDLKDGAETGLRVYRGALGDKEVFFEEHLEASENEGGEDPAIQRTVYAVSRETAESAAQPETAGPDTETMTGPSLEQQRQLLADISLANAHRMAENGLIQRAANVLHQLEYAKDQNQRVDAGRQPGDTEDEAAIRLADEVEASVAYDRYAVSSHLGDDLDEIYSIHRRVRGDTYDRVDVGRVSVDPIDGAMAIEPVDGFEEDDVRNVRGFVNHLQELRADGTLPDLTDDLLTVHNQTKADAEHALRIESSADQPGLADVRRQQAERAQSDPVLAAMQVEGASTEQLAAYTDSIERMELAEQERGRLFTDREAFIKFEDLSLPDDDFDPGFDTGYEQGQSMPVLRSSTGERELWTFMGVDTKTNTIVACDMDPNGFRLAKHFPLPGTKAPTESA